MDGLELPLKVTALTQKFKQIGGLSSFLLFFILKGGDYLFVLVFYPGHDEGEKVLLFVCAQFTTFGNVVPFFQ